jgi:penicillin-binding protein 2
VSSSSGTAASAFAGFPLSSYPVAGKTGTAEVAGKQPHSWFAAFAPAQDPQFVVVAVVEQGGHGSQVAAPIVRRVLEGLLSLEPGAFELSAPTE